MKSNMALVMGLGWLTLMVGCAGNKPMTMEKRFAQIEVGQTNSTEVMELLDSPGMLQTAGAVSVAIEQRWGTELGIVQFNQSDAKVQRKDYFRHRSVQQAPMFTREQTYLKMESLVPTEILDQPFENENRKSLAILQYFLDAIKADIRPFLEDQKTTSMMGLGRHGLEVGISQLSLQPRQSHNLLEPKGFTYDHPTLGICQIFLEEKDNGIYTLIISSGAWADPLTAW